MAAARPLRVRSLPPLTAFLVLAVTAASQVKPITLTASDAVGDSSFNAAGNWSDKAPPAPGKAYTTGSFLLRTPQADSETCTFAGDSLTINNTNGGSGGLIVKTRGTSTITIGHLIIDGGVLRDGDDATDSLTLAGNIAITANGATLTQQETWTVASNISGTGNLTLNCVSPGPSTTFSGTNTFTGNLILNSDTISFELARAGSLTFAIGANGVNNSIQGSGDLALNGTFRFDLTRASKIVGDSWTIIGSGPVATYGPGFTITGFTHSGKLWTSANGRYQFNTATGVLSVVSAGFASDYAK